MGVVYKIIKHLKATANLIFQSIKKIILVTGPVLILPRKIHHVMQSWVFQGFLFFILFVVVYHYFFKFTFSLPVLLYLTFLFMFLCWSYNARNHTLGSYSWKKLLVGSVVYLTILSIYSYIYDTYVRLAYTVFLIFFLFFAYLLNKVISIFYFISFFQSVSQVLREEEKIIADHYAKELPMLNKLYLTSRPFIIFNFILRLNTTLQQSIGFYGPVFELFHYSFFIMVVFYMTFFRFYIIFFLNTPSKVVVSGFTTAYGAITATVALTYHYCTEHRVDFLDHNHLKAVNLFLGTSALNLKSEFW